MSVTNLTILLANPAFPNLRVFTITLVLSKSWYNRRQPEYLSALKKKKTFISLSYTFALHSFYSRIQAVRHYYITSKGKERAWEITLGFLQLPLRSRNFTSRISLDKVSHVVILFNKGSFHMLGESHKYCDTETLKMVISTLLTKLKIS